MHDVTLELKHVSLCDLKYVVLLQGQAQAARKRAAGTMDEYTFIAEDAEAADQAGSVPAIQQVSAEELYRKELAEEMQVQLQPMRLQLLMLLYVAFPVTLFLCFQPQHLAELLVHNFGTCTPSIRFCAMLLCLTAALWSVMQTHEQPLSDMAQYRGNV